jgi:SAM-dependent methyltransferase
VTEVPNYVSPKIIALDEEGFFILAGGVRLGDLREGKLLLQNLSMDEYGGCWTTWDGETILVEPFDKPLVAQQIEKTASEVYLLGAYGFRTAIRLETLCLDDWDRFHGLTQEDIPFVFSRKAQAEFFNAVDDFEDDSFTLWGQKYPTPPFYIDDDTAGETPFWSQKYSDSQVPWDLGAAHPALNAILPQIKINKCRILNLGCGRGHDAAYFSKLGHVVTGVDFSETAIEQAKTRYGTSANLNWIVGDAFSPKGFPPVDLIFEHTLFCAIQPSQRKKLIQQWKRSLDDRGHLLGIFFVHPQRRGPPHGGSEWELREMLEKDFRLLFWKRWAFSPKGRHGKELVIYAQKK